MSTLFERVQEALAPDYVLERELAGGGMGIVFVAWEPAPVWGISSRRRAERARWQGRCR